MTPIKALTITRIFDAPRRLIFDAWVEVKHFKEWWMPRGFTNPVCEFQGSKMPGRAEVGSKIRIVSHHLDFGNLPMAGTFEEVTPIERIVFTSEAFPDANGVMQLINRNVVTFSEVEAGRTQVVLHATVLQSLPEHAAALAGMQQGWSETLDRLGERVEDTSDREMNISRLVDAPRELVWKVWTEPERIKEWWGPNGFTSTIHAYNLMPGGKWHLTMHGPDGTDFPNHIRFIEIIPNERLIYDHAAIDHDAPQHDADAQFRSFVYFADEGGKTRVTMRGVFRTVAYKNLVVEKYGALEGQRQHIARMAAYLAKLR